MKPSIKKGIIAASVCAISLVGIQVYMHSTKVIDVHSVATLNSGYWDNPASSSGFVSNSATQSVLYDSSKTIQMSLSKKANKLMRVILYYHMT